MFHRVRRLGWSGWIGLAVSLWTGTHAVLGWIGNYDTLLTLPGRIPVLGAWIISPAGNTVILLLGLALVLWALFRPEPTHPTVSPLVRLALEPSSPQSPQPPPTFTSITQEQLSSYRNRGLMQIEADRLIEPYLGQWMEVRVKVKDVVAALGMTELVRVLPDYDGTADRADLVFKRTDWDARPVPRGAVVRARGQLMGVYSDSIMLDNCHFID